MPYCYQPIAAQPILREVFPVRPYRRVCSYGRCGEELPNFGSTLYLRRDSMEAIDC